MSSFKYEIKEVSGFPTIAMADRIYPIEPFHTIHIHNFVSAGNLLIKEGSMDYVPWETSKIKDYEKSLAKYKRYKWLPRFIRNMLGIPIHPPNKIDVVSENCRGFGVDA